MREIAINVGKATLLYFLPLEILQVCVLSVLTKVNPLEIEKTGTEYSASYLFSLK